MARFPTTEAEIKALAQNIAAGLEANPAVYPSPPVTAVDLAAVLDSYITASDQAVATRAAAEEATSVKNAAEEELVTDMKAILRYAEDAVARDDAKLSLLGWGARRPLTPTPPIEAPQQPRSLEAPRQGASWVFLDWKAPLESDPVAAYRIQRRERPAGDWIDIAMAIETEATLSNQEPRKEWEYRVIAANAGGDSDPSNTVAVVL